ncbi:methionine gamma-lyase family protein [Lactobacillus mulieris]|uniref:Methionine gamma-lyase family protein n=1 Tax=Lactobacillus mulieris TaxID=2508708 RepID=A0AAW5X0B3_9LACO|nr:methionine gamma-lyase family protein [Lactobacillus mulieris]MCZ3622672.1 methionine gamma-lyase family protein [Lactobacillus mulieris]MCZ3624310.1 methionine gamma-lyase family protein [Lactobacillus mulieris]MCZ3636679.1 methionine gamma-lyase family protein [Lactobacillus mulieris]MCZ3690411.1 methionine gamma-lyase family protein [Lactobacillus mulieris]MCZ3696333.1 methionine gamma-lyase family protein [Lactobacillus mulieris]
MNNYPKELIQIVKEVNDLIAPKLAELDEQVVYNQAKVLEAYKHASVAEADLKGTNGYGDDDTGRDKLEQIFAEVFQTEAALVRPQFVSGTHTLATAMKGNLQAGDTLTYLTGMPYDTLQTVIGLTPHKQGTLMQRGIKFSYVPLKDNQVDYQAAKEILLRDKPKMVAIQRSKGYSTRPSYNVGQIKEMIAFVKEVLPTAIVFIDNCYGEFSEKHEPTEYGADLMAGSLIKNGGGGIAKTGGYIVGKKQLVENATYELLAPGCEEEGATLTNMQDFLQGFFIAPNTVVNAIKGMVFSSALLEKMGLEVAPRWDAVRTDLIQNIIFHDPEKMVKFAKELQKNSPVDSFVDPVPYNMPGYEDKVVMAAGTFVSGSTIEFSADGPIREPYALYMQGGLTYAHVKIAVINAVNELFFKKI